VGPAPILPAMDTFSGTRNPFTPVLALDQVSRYGMDAVARTSDEEFQKSTSMSDNTAMAAPDDSAFIADVGRMHAQCTGR
jgi:hypothetical protein